MWLESQIIELLVRASLEWRTAPCVSATFGQNADESHIAAEARPVSIFDCFSRFCFFTYHPTACSIFSKID